MEEESLSPKVFYCRRKPRYDQVPLQQDASIRDDLRALWKAYGNDPDNPLCPFLQPGGTLVIKPNWVTDYNRSGEGMECLVTHSSLIQCILEEGAKALEGRGRIIVGDAPIQGCRFEVLIDALRMRAIAAAVREKHPQLEIEIADWRLTVIGHQGSGSLGGPCSRQTFRDQSEAVGEYYVEVDLGRESFLEEIAEFADRFRVTMYKPSLMNLHHRPGRHQYLLRKEALDADLLVNLAKMKTHEKAGLTGAMKNLVGVNGHKEYLPHHIQGSYSQGGDSYPHTNMFSTWAEKVYDRWWEEESDLNDWQRWTYRVRFKALHVLSRLRGAERVPYGSWSGNETLWRMTLDLNHLLYFGGRRPQRIINIVDGIIAGEGEGPLSPTRKEAGILVLGDNPAYLDAFLGRLMGYHLSRIPTIYHAVNHRRSKFGGPLLDEMPVFAVDENGEARPVQSSQIENLRFQAPRNWQRAVAPRRSLPTKSRKGGL
jgi:hypothetical protein